jgi:GNAT superfamily N-acetyltransferase
LAEQGKASNPPGLALTALFKTSISTGNRARPGKILKPERFIPHRGCSMKKAHSEDFDDYALLLQEDPDLLHALFLLRNGWCTVYVDDREKPQTILVIDSTPDPEVYIIGKWNDWLVPRVEDAHPWRLFATQGTLRARSPFKDLVRSSAMVHWFDESEKYEWDGIATRLEYADDLEGFPDELWRGYETVETLLDEGIASGVFFGEELVSAATTYSMGDEYFLMKTYTKPEHRRKGYATDAAGALMKHCMENLDLRPVLISTEQDEGIDELAVKLRFPNTMPSEMDMLIRPDKEE